jgi:hypothetical protein
MTAQATTNPPALTTADLHLAGKSHDQRLTKVTEAMVDGALERLRQAYGTVTHGPAGIPDDTLRAIAEIAVGGAWPVACDSADLLGSDGELVSRQWDTIDRLRQRLLDAGVQLGPRRPGGDG